MIEPDGYREKCGWLIPDSDVRGVPAMHASVGLLDQVYRHCKGFDVAVQAGGCVGIYPKAMSERFGVVYTFEPDPMNFRCLCANVPSENVFKFNAALGDGRSPIGMQRVPENVGAHFVDGNGSIPTLRIDDLNLQVCNLIHLDVEGFECRALHGAAETIMRCRPVIVIEDKKGCSDRYGMKIGETPDFVMGRFDYRKADQVLKDVVLVPC
jgi:FkbM family methyltransferase